LRETVERVLSGFAPNWLFGVGGETVAPRVASKNGRLCVEEDMVLPRLARKLTEPPKVLFHRTRLLWSNDFTWP
jgi:hypothetical protein